ncbi:Transcriptional regulator, LysR family [Lachnospiraceae bacterium TWA4]|nr:Transcriptional regulator, LysR family [Lachnospiraceae bacterium TWA4]
MNLKQPTVSCHISALEKELNTRLFIRTTKDVDLSSEGETLYRYAKPMIDMQNQIEDIFLQKNERENSPLSIAASTIPSQYLLPDILSDYVKTYPSQPFKVSELDSAEVAERVEYLSVDVGFTGTVIDKSNCKYVPIYEDELVIATPNTEKYQKLKEGKVPLKKWITNEPFIVREEGSGTRKESERALKKKGISPEDLTVVACIENPEAIKRSVKNQLGVTIISKLAIEREVRLGELLEIPLGTGVSKRNLYLVYNKNVHLSEKLKNFIELVRESYM